MRISCQDIEPLLQDYIDGYLLSSQREVLETHLRSCGACSELLAGLSRIDDRLGRLEPLEAPALLTQSILSALPSQAYRPPFLRQFAQYAQYAAAPALIVLLLVAGFLLKGRPFNGSAGTREVDVVFVSPGAARVSVVGDFNGWDPTRNPMTRGRKQEAWRARLALPPGVYQYNFVIDGTVWEKDPQAKNYLPDGFGGENSVIIING